ncbi:hypothetical protein, conserved [Trypanosoma brucei brucei TREU927]|uniref:Uncharacterized protein n=1 Tax=Trypanosoma brucei brucei (strain 927/4 GUTat10.1) TaxID=185431 RepID=Q585R5_TRYB2|nr:hypothetical protein, conserved [Trypanosoma brucei brucei TREU927]AAQ15604.1 hypothetical protein, conserved [Trypanosoma brucei brucei TREU927]AAX79545.1 hypothetical protein, conserved [Trypanosoma brucei]
MKYCEVQPQTGSRGIKRQRELEENASIPTKGSRATETRGHPVNDPVGTSEPLQCTQCGFVSQSKGGTTPNTKIQHRRGHPLDSNAGTKRSRSITEQEVSLIWNTVTIGVNDTCCTQCRHTHVSKDSLMEHFGGMHRQHPFSVAKESPPPLRSFNVRGFHLHFTFVNRNKTSHSTSGSSIHRHQKHEICVERKHTHSNECEENPTHILVRSSLKCSAVTSGLRAKICRR